MSVELHDQRGREKLLVVDSLDVTYDTQDGPVRALRDVSLTLRPGETLGIAGESGSGKSTLALAILRHLDDNGRIDDGSIEFDGASLLEMTGTQLRSIRGSRIAHVPQDPNASLNPSLEVGEQIRETILEHQNVSKAEARTRTLDLLETVGIPDQEYNAERYPHELSGGMQQRILIAMALSCDPELLILDEPTTGLDVTTQAKILDLINDLKRQSDAAIVLITHNLSVIAQTSDRVAIMYAGEVLERGSVEEIFTTPANPYTQGLLAALPTLEEDQELRPIEGSIPDLTAIPEGCIFADRCEFAEPDCRRGTIEEERVTRDERQVATSGTNHEVLETGHYSKCRRWEASLESPIEPAVGERPTTERGDRLLEARGVKKHFGEESFFDRIFGSEPPVRAVDGVDLNVHESETVGVVGESGCGKSTLGQLLLRLLELTDGTVQFRGEDVASLSGSDLTEFRSENQVVFQNPHSSLNPRKRVESELSRPLKRFTDLDDDERDERVDELLAQVNLDESYRSRYPHELSGGEKQRVAIARAFAADPAFIVLDEPVSALDVSVQANVLNLLSSLRHDYGSSYLFISHDLSVVKHISDRIAVMYLGEVVEVGPKETVFQPPYHPYTRALLSNIPSTDPTEERDTVRLEGDVPSARDPPSGCPFHTRCPQKIGDVCEQEHPALEEYGSDGDEDEAHKIACHLDIEEMSASLDESVTDD